MSAAEQRAAVVESIFEAAAEELGDVTEPVMAEAYRLCPESRASFEHHGLGDSVALLEANMVEQTLYAVLAWPEDAETSKIAIAGTLPHHIETLDVPADFFWCLFDALFDVIGKVIDPVDTLKLAVWRELHTEIRQFFFEECAALGAETEQRATA